MKRFLIVGITAIIAVIGLSGCVLGGHRGQVWPYRSVRLGVYRYNYPDYRYGYYYYCPSHRIYYRHSCPHIH